MSEKNLTIWIYYFFRVTLTLELKKIEVFHFKKE